MSNLLDIISFGISSLEDFEQRNVAQNVLKILFDGPKFFRPKKYDRYEPLKNEVKSDMEPLVDFWTAGHPGVLETTEKEGIIILRFCPDGDFMAIWRKSVPPSFSDFSGGVPIKKLQAKPVLFKGFITIFKSIVLATDAVYASVNNASFRGWDTPMNLNLRLPEIPWLSVYGHPYIEMFGKERIMSAPFHKIEELESGHLVVQATESVYEPVPRELRESIRKHLGEDAFMAGTRWKYKDGRAPKFDFSKVMPSKQN